MHLYQVKFTFIGGESLCIDVYSPEKIEDPTPFELVDLDAANIDLPNVLMMEVKYIGYEIN